ncbi:MAG: hypothetical protein RLZZ624_154 [Cyanobacteriota bacterium]
MAPSSSPAASWLSLTALGRLYGISAVHCGRLLHDAGLRQADGTATHRALQEGLAYQQQPARPRHGPLWAEQGCGPILEASGLKPMANTTLVQQWVTLLSALDEGSPSICTTAAEMATELPRELVAPVNEGLRALGSPFQVADQGRSRLSARRGGRPRHSSTSDARSARH